MDLDRLHAALDRRWNRIDVVAETGSTNLDLVRDTAAPDRSVLAAEYQTAGRGRLARSWVCPPGAGLIVSVLFRPPVTLARWGWLPLLAGVAVHDAITAAADVEISLKWPNDVLDAAGERKLAGILAQTADDAVVIGIGANVTVTAEELPVPGATSLALLGALDVDRTDLLIEVLGRLDTLFARWADVDGDAEACGLAEAYRRRCVTLGRRVRATFTDEGDCAAVEGEAAALDEMGRLVLRTADGLRTVGAGDVQHLRSL